MRKLIAIVLLPLSLVPVALAIPRVADERESFQARYLDRDALPAPDVRADAAVRVPAYRGRVPVLVYHGISDDPADRGRWTHTRAAFARHMAALADAGFHTISAGDYAAFLRGEDVDLPPKPLLLTFDDGRVDSFRGADAVLERHGFQATMFAIAGATVEGSRTYLNPDELQELHASERWDVRFHGGAGHTRIETADGLRPFYAGLEPGESVAAFRERVEDDLDDGLAQLAEIVPDAELGDLFAVPYSDYSQARGGDVRLATVMSHAGLERFDALFVQRADVEPTRPGDRGVIARYEPGATETPTHLLRALRQGLKEG